MVSGGGTLGREGAIGASNDGVISIRESLDKSNKNTFNRIGTIGAPLQAEIKSDEGLSMDLNDRTLRGVTASGAADDVARQASGVALVEANVRESMGSDDLTSSKFLKVKDEAAIKPVAQEEEI